MTEPSVGIIGGTNGMGRWLAELLTARGCRVCVTGRKTAATAADAARSCDVVVVAVPIAATSGVIAHVGPLLQSSQALMDLTSLKEEPVALMLSSSPAEVVGCHPLFGPQAADPAEHSIVLCRGRGETWYAWMKAVFEQAGYTVLEKTPAEHDRVMAVVQALSHLNTIALGMAVAAAGFSAAQLEPFATPVFKTKMELVKKVFTESPELYADIIAGNPNRREVFAVYENVLRTLSEPVGSGDGKKLKHAMETAAEKLFAPKP